VGLFVIMHLFTNAQMAWPDGGASFQHEVDFIHSTPALLFIELTLWGSIAFHAGLGVIYASTGRSNLKSYHGPRYEGNLRYTLQRSTGYIALIFIFLHIATLRWRWSFGVLETPFYATDHEGRPLAMASTAKALQAHWLVTVIYLVGVLAVVFHWCNGLWTAAITWGLTISVKSQKRWGMVCTGLAVALTVFSLAAMAGALRYKVTAEDEKRIRETFEKGPRRASADASPAPRS
jgi:succinate dehydrogenase / fumarate reductase cytochrome b subunit